MRILILSADSGLHQRIEKLDHQAIGEIHHESSIAALKSHLRKVEYEIVILSSDVCDPGEADWSNLIASITARSPQTQIIALVEPEHLKVAQTAINAGGYLYSRLPICDSELKMLIDMAISDRPHYYRKLSKSERRSETAMGPLIGKSRQMRDVYDQIRKIAETDIPVLIMGETGTGKELVANTIHRRSRRKEGPYLPVNLASLPTELAASELFGHEKGSFSGAVKQHRGVFERAVDGTVFLDEIDSIGEKVRVSLLRLIEQQQFFRLGGQASIRSNARLITASNVDLEDMTRENKFRKDLFYRLDGFRITLPPLRDRAEDIQLLAGRMVATYTQRFNKRVDDISEDFIDHLKAHDWPGNVREFKNVLQRSVLVCDGPQLKPIHLPPRLLKRPTQAKRLSFDIGTPLDEIERRMVIKALEATQNNRKEAARLLGISRRAIYNKLNKHDIQ